MYSRSGDPVGRLRRLLHSASEDASTKGAPTRGCLPMVALITHYGVALVFANVLLQQIGLPIPVYPTLIVAGALAAEGIFSASEIFAAALIACAISDATWYVAGRLYGRRVMKLPVWDFSLSPDSCVQQSEDRFHRWGAFTLVLAKFVPGLSIVMSSLAGTTQLALRSFALLDGLGAAIWIGVAVSSGMLFHREIGRLIAHLQELGAIAIGVIAMLFAGYIASKWWRRRRFYNRLRMARISVHELHRLIAEGQRPLVVDLRTPLFRDQDGRFIPGALVSGPCTAGSMARPGADRSRGDLLLHLSQRGTVRSCRQKINRSRLHPCSPTTRRPRCLDCGRLSS